MPATKLDSLKSSQINFTLITLSWKEKYVFSSFRNVFKQYWMQLLNKNIFTSFRTSAGDRAIMFLNYFVPVVLLFGDVLPCGIKVFAISTSKIVNERLGGETHWSTRKSCGEVCSPRAPPLYCRHPREAFTPILVACQKLAHDAHSCQVHVITFAEVLKKLDFSWLQGQYVVINFALLLKDKHSGSFQIKRNE